MGARHPQALQDRLFEESKRRDPWTPEVRYRILLRRRDGKSERRDAPPSLEEARAEVRRYFEFDTLDLYEGAWIFEEVVL